MISLRFDQLAAITGGTLYNTDSARRIFTGVSIDTRSLRKGELYIAIRGSKHDGHDFIPQAVKRGAAGIISEMSYPGLGRIRGDVPVVGVRNTHETMMALAEQLRRSFGGRIAAITGSNGKTTTKEFAFHLISAVEQHVYRSPGNFNNLFGVPLAFFAMPDKARVAIMELGISTPGEMTRLGRIVRPNVIVITNIGPSHLAYLGSVEEVARAKLELVAVSSANVPVILNADDPILMATAGAYCKDFITFALDAEAWFRPDSVQPDEAGATVTIEGHRFRLPLGGRHQVYNLLAAYALLKTLDYTFEGVNTSTIRLQTGPMRGQTICIGRVTAVVDCYNANPESVRAGLEAFAATAPGRRRVIVLGDMLELGKESARYHEQVGRELASHRFDVVLLVGPDMRHAEQAMGDAGTAETVVRHYRDASACADAIGTWLRPDDHVYIKGSRTVGLEAVVDAIKRTEGEI